MDVQILKIFDSVDILLDIVGSQGILGITFIQRTLKICLYSHQFKIFWYSVSWKNFGVVAV